MSHHIYEIRNHATGKSYIGCTKTVPKRMREHQRARPEIFEGGQWDVVILESHESLEDAFEAEVAWIAAKGTTEIGYNRQSGGKAGHTAHALTRMLMSKSQSGRTHAAETIAKIVSKTTGQRRSAAFREAVRQRRLGAPGTHDPSQREDWPERLAKMVAGRKGKASWCKGKSGPEMSAAVHKAWETRRQKGEASASAKKGWETRRAKAQQKGQ